MITNLKIEGFKAIDKLLLPFKPITILTGTNSSGKSSVLQTIIQMQHFVELHELFQKNITNGGLNTDFNLSSKFSGLVQPISDIRNKNTNARQVVIEIEYNKLWNKLVQKDSSKDDINGGDVQLDSHYIFNLHYLSADRLPIRLHTRTDKLSQNSIYFMGQNTSYVFNKNRNLTLPEELCENHKARTLDFQLNHWLSKIVNQKISTISEYNDVQKQVAFWYSMNDVENIAPNSVGTGQNHLVHILLMCLLAKKNDVVIIENPELHLHPKAQAALSEFFTMIANAGIQIVLETHSEHIINKFCYEVYKKNLKSTDIIIHYKASVEQNFENIYINEKGHYSEESGVEIVFPGGFFDATLNEILEVS